MCTCASSVASLGVTFLGIATSLCILCLFAPFWMMNKASSDSLMNLLQPKSSGIYLQCYNAFDSNRDCSWIKFDNQSDWFQAVMVLWAIGCGLLLLVEIASFVICCESCKTPRYAAFICFATLFAAISLVVAVILYAVKNGDKWDRDNNMHFDWGYYIAIAGAGFAVIAFLFFGSSIYCLRSSNN